ncbi:hypothetical protein AXF42_Ash008441 [Apostasia shenzhenica]|uniref:Uncharacterized protein n=1 Tax=Apostasia shenzhenica TaxID=1088818 RepID=A0A2I0AXV6_9ASPA|nr:hypothetical protein AXF42_Ash008441 [Apostasia shenzhenica]
MPINILLIYVIGSAFGLLIIRITKAPPNLMGPILGCCASGNLGFMLLIIIPSTCDEKGSPFGDPAKCHAESLEYASLSMAISDILFWSYSYNIVRILSKTMKKIDQEVVIDDEESQLKCIEEGRESKPAINGFRRLFSPATLGVMTGLTIGMISPFKKIIIGDDAPLRAIEGAISLLSDAAIPTATLIMGGNLMKGGVVTQTVGVGEGECSIILFWTYAVTLICFPLWSSLFMSVVS